MACVKCSKLAAGAEDVVWVGRRHHDDIMFVGEAPGADQDAQASFAVGAVGAVVERKNNPDDESDSRDSVYIANILKCAPTLPGKNRQTATHTGGDQTCIPFLHEQID